MRSQQLLKNHKRITRSLFQSYFHHRCCYRSYYHIDNCHSFATKPIDVEFLTDDDGDDNDDESTKQMKLSNCLRPYHQNQKPVLIKNYYKANDRNCNAIKKWSDLEYLRSTIGEDTTCLVEIGGSYTNSNTSRPEIRFGDYIEYMKKIHEKYGSKQQTIAVEEERGIYSNNERCNKETIPKLEEIVYMAQNDLYSELYKDFTIPELCHKALHNVGEGKIYSTMFWFGPRHSVSPLHFDPLDNLLIGFGGRKNVLLYPRTYKLKSMGNNDDNHFDSDDNDVNDSTIDVINWHYAGHSGQQYNTSPIDVYNPDYDKYPLFANAPTAIECTLYPGDVLFIPSRWWHHVTSIDTAVSVNIWWR